MSLSDCLSMAMNFRSTPLKRADGKFCLSFRQCLSRQTGMSALLAADDFLPSSGNLCRLLELGDLLFQFEAVGLERFEDLLNFAWFDARKLKRFATLSHT